MDGSGPCGLLNKKCSGTSSGKEEQSTQ